MNDTPNTTHWEKGDLVIHDADAKTDHMLMEVIGYNKEGLCLTKYVEPTKRSQLFANDLKYLHDPFRKDIRQRWR